ncbi:PAS domain-containing sensor histidine kinase [Labilibacter marinus]|uniref:PAS domain-containing sensor histidine kinase n=1 Tax=Labilibacter marinus TaxID=1477105 RepID=UPI0008299A85|nr:PAS domain S-box protein [Labilibacter marinus]
MLENRDSYMREIERLKTELDKVKHREKYYHLIYESNNDLIFIHNKEGHIIDVNQSVVDRLGYSKEEMLTLSVADLSSDVKPYTLDEAKVHLGNAHYTERYLFEWQSKSKSGDIFWVEVSLKKVELNGQEHIIAIARDINEKKKAEQELFETKNLLEASIAQSSSGILIADAPNVNIRVANNAAFGIRGERSELLTDIDVEKHGERWQTYKPDGTPYPPLELPLSRAVMKGEITTGEDLILKDKSGDVHWINANAAPIYDSKGNITAGIVVFLDVTDKKNIELELRQHKENLEKLVKEKTEDLEAVNEELKTINDDLFEKNEIIKKQNSELKSTLENLKKTQTQLLHADKMASLGILTAGVAHELNNPLNYISGAYLTLNNYFSKNEDISQKDVTISILALKEGLSRATNIIQSLNQFSRDSKIIDEDCAIHEIIDNCLIMIRQHQEDDIAIVKDYWKGDILFKGNVGNLHQVFLNILTNAIQSIKREGEITIKTSLENNNCVISISDSGCGIPKEDMKRITDPFFTTKPPGEGTGLGLSITYNIIQEHHGNISFKSEPNKGTIVTVRLPV